MNKPAFNLLAVFFFMAGSAYADTFYVSQTDPFANDENPGTQMAPLESIARAAELIRGGDHVIVGPGRYVEDIDLDNSHSGTPGTPTVWSASPTFAATIEGLKIRSDYVVVEGFAIVQQPKPGDMHGTGIVVRDIKPLDDPEPIRNVVTVLAEATDNVGVATVRFLLNGLSLLPGDSSEPFSATWDTVIVPDGVYALTAVASDTAGNEGADTILVEIHNDPCQGRQCR